MNTWNKIPLLRLLLPLILGISFSIYINIGPNILIYILLGVLLGLLLVYSLKKYFTVYKRRWVFGLLIHLFIFFIGAVILEINKPNNLRNNFITYTSSESIVSLDEDVIVKKNSNKVLVNVLFVKQDDKWISTSGKAILYFTIDSLSNELLYGEYLLVSGEWKTIGPPKNPAQFNYKNYLSNIGVTAQQYLSSSQWKKMGIKNKSSLKGKAFIYQKRLLNLLKQNFKNNELAVISALLIGYKDLLAREMLQSYAATGAVHILAVSGLHVGIIYVVINSLLLFLRKIKYGNYIKSILLLIILWMYALLTGLSPSVLRATTMFSFIIVGKALNRQTNIYNTLAASAFVLLAYNPFLLLQLGFQLSYLAVIGIVYLQPKLVSLIEVPNWLLNKIWIISTVAVAAQLATFPLVLYYFHQFPTYFLLSNIIIIPLVTLIINLSVLLFVFSFIPVVFNVLVLVVNNLLFIQNTLVIWFQELPYSLKTGISINLIEVLLIYLMLFLLIYAWVYKKARSMQFGLIIAIVFMTMQIQENRKIDKQHIIVIYDVPKYSAIDFFNGRDNYFIASSQLGEDQQKVAFFLQNFRWKKGVVKTDLVSSNFERENFYRSKNYIKFFETRILLWDKGFLKPINNLTFDYIIVSGKVKLDLENINCKQVVIDSSVSKYNWEQIKKECLKWDIPFYNVNMEGAFIFSFY